MVEWIFNECKIDEVIFKCPSSIKYVFFLIFIQFLEYLIMKNYSHYIALIKNPTKHSLLN